jgi:hypothetical protein
MYTLLFERADYPFDHTVLLRAMRRDELLAQAVAAYECDVAARGADPSPLSDRSKNGVGTRPSVPKRAIRACSRALPAVHALPLRDRCQPSNSRVWQSITSASVAPPSRPAHTRPKSVGQRSLGIGATDGTAWMRGLKPIGRLRTCQPIN